MEPLITHLTLVRENRSLINQKHDLVDVIFLVISAILGGAEGWTDIEVYGVMKKDWLMKYRPFNNGIPSRQTIAKILQSIDKESLLTALFN